MTTLRSDVNGVAYVGKARSDGEVDVLVAQRPEATAARTYDATTTPINAGATVTFDVTSSLQGCTNVSVSIIEMTQSYEVSIQTKPVAAAAWYNDATVGGTAMASASIASARHGFAFNGPLAVLVQVVVKNTSASPATLKGVYVSGR